MKKIVLFAMGLVMSMTTFAQNKIETTISGDIVSNNIWRGQDLGNVSLQPTLGIGYKGFSLTAWGSVGLSNSEDAKMLELILAYTTKGLNVSITDYWASKGGGDPKGRFFKYGAHETNHVFEANIGYNFGFANIQWYTFFAGNDYNAADGTLTQKGFFVGNDYKEPSGKRAYSSYFEANVPFKLVTVDWTATAGVVPYASDGYQTSGFAVTNLALKATKDIKVTKTFSIPIFAQVVANPCSQKAYLVLGLTLQP